MGVYIWNRLPSEYQEVEYIQSSGTQWLQIGTSFKTSYKTVVDFQMTATGGDQVVVGIYKGGVTKRYGLDAWQSNFKVITGGSDWSNTISEDTNRHKFTINKSTVTVDGTNYSCSYSDYTYTTGLGVFTYLHDSQTEANSKNKLFKLDIYDENGNHIYDLVPCYRKSDSVIGLYDLVNNQFYTNSGTGTFSKGSDVNNYYEKPLKNAYIGEYEFATKYQEVEYIQSSGTQYINTGYQPNNNSEIECKLNMASITNSWDSIYGATNTSSGASKRAFLLQIQKSTSKMYATIYSNYGSYQISISSASGISTNTDYTTKQSNTDFFINGVSQGTYSSSSYTVPYNMYIFGYNEGGTSKSMVSMKLYYTKIWDSGTLVRNFVPCYRKSDNVIGLYDLVNDVFYTNSGTGTFTKGLDVN